MSNENSDEKYNQNSDEKSHHKPKILVIGSTGVGKSSIVKYLSGKNIKISDSAVGCTLECEKYETVDCIYADTVGLNEGKHGSVRAADAFESIVRFLKMNKDGFNLVIFVIKKGRITTDLCNNYALLTTLLDESVPMLLCITGCENDNPLDEWYSKESDNFINAELNFKDAASVCFAQGGRFENEYKRLREESVLILKKKIKKLKLDKRVPLYKGYNGLMNLLVKVWNWFSRKVLKEIKFVIVNVDLVSFFVTLGCKLDEATQKAIDLQTEEN